MENSANAELNLLDGGISFYFPYLIQTECPVCSAIAAWGFEKDCPEISSKFFRSLQFIKEKPVAALFILSCNRIYKIRISCKGLL